MITGIDSRKRLRYKDACLRVTSESLLSSIVNASVMEGEVLGEDKQYKKGQVEDVLEEGALDRIESLLSLAYSEVVEILYPYSNEDSGPEYADGGDDVDAYVIRLCVPETMSGTTLSLLQKLVREYMVCRVLVDWLGVTNVGSEEKWQVKLENVKKEICSCKNHRSRAVRRKGFPF